MKVVCIKNFPHSWRLTPGKTYQVFYRDYYQYVLDDRGHVLPYNFPNSALKSKDYFIPLDELREQKLDKLGI
jgi:hypothetical protein